MLYEKVHACEIFYAYYYYVLFPVGNYTGLLESMEVGKNVLEKVNPTFLKIWHDAIEVMKCNLMKTNLMKRKNLFLRYKIILISLK